MVCSIRATPTRGGGVGREREEGEGGRVAGGGERVRRCDFVN